MPALPITCCHHVQQMWTSPKTRAQEKDTNAPRSQGSLLRKNAPKHGLLLRPMTMKATTQMSVKPSSPTPCLTVQAKKKKRAPPRSTDQNSSPTPEQLQIAELRGKLAQATATAAPKSAPNPEQLLIAELKGKLEVAELRGKLAQATATAAPKSSPTPEQLLIAELKEKLAQATASAEQREILDLKRHNEFLTAQLAAHAAKPDNNVSPQALLQVT